jgi:hypothetical protein
MMELWNVRNSEAIVQHKGLTCHDVTVVLVFNPAKLRILDIVNFILLIITQFNVVQIEREL